LALLDLADPLHVFERKERPDRALKHPREPRHEFVVQA
jgi:hypothetical protein